MYSGQSHWQTFKMTRHRISGATSFLPLLSGFGWHGETQWVQVHGRVLGFVYYTAYADRSASAYALSRNRKVNSLVTNPAMLHSVSLRNPIFLPLLSGFDHKCGRVGTGWT